MRDTCAVSQYFVLLRYTVYGISWPWRYWYRRISIEISRYREYHTTDISSKLITTRMKWVLFWPSYTVLKLQTQYAWKCTNSSYLSLSIHQITSNQIYLADRILQILQTCTAFSFCYVKLLVRETLTVGCIYRSPSSSSVNDSVLNQQTKK